MKLINISERPLMFLISKSISIPEIIKICFEATSSMVLILPI
jgi:hypothetical protein